MKVGAIIPARFQSLRFPGKLLEDLAGKPILQHVYERAVRANLDFVAIAADDERIVDMASGFGAHVFLTDKQHRSGTERLAQAIDILKLDDDDLVVNVQGDEPMIHPALIQQVANNLKTQPSFKMATLCEKITDINALRDPNKVKVIFNEAGSAQYFSRAIIPWARDHFQKTPDVMPEKIDYYLHVGIYAYRAGFVKQYIQWPSTIWEQVECLEQLRVLYHGEKIHVAVACEKVGAGIDTVEELTLLRKRLAG
jgi:3-deoxy-manno-octulosonate cytidylyltransferase (CMP-KDO synthetase)